MKKRRSTYCAELDAARLALVSLLAVMSDEQVEAVQMALTSIAPMSETSGAALVELRTALSHPRAAIPVSPRRDGS